MFRFFLLFSLSFASLLACDGGYDSCIKKLKDSASIYKDKLSIPLKNNQKLLYSKTTPKQKILKYDPFLSLYLVEEKTNFRYPFSVNKHLTLGYAGVNDNCAVEGKITFQQLGLNKFSRFNEALFTPSLLLNSCCMIEGIVTENGIIQKEYIQRFLDSKTGDYGDIGVRIGEKEGNASVVSIDPFMRNNPFLPSDIIVSFDGKKVKSASTLMRDILFTKIGSSYKVEIKREGKIHTLKVKSYQRYGGGFLSDTFLEQKGIYFNRDLEIMKLSKNAQTYGLKLGDQILQANAKAVASQEDLRRELCGEAFGISLLIQRDGFQFFLQIQEKQKREL